MRVGQSGSGDCSSLFLSRQFGYIAQLGLISQCSGAVQQLLYMETENPAETETSCHIIEKYCFNF